MQRKNVISFIGLAFILLACTRVSASPRSAVCEFRSNGILRAKKLCSIDFYNGGMYQITTSEGTLSLVTRGMSSDGDSKARLESTGEVYEVSRHADVWISFSSPRNEIIVTYSH